LNESAASVWNLLWSDAPAARVALVVLWGAFAAGVGAIHGPLLARLRSLRALRQALSGIYSDTVENVARRREAMGSAFHGSPLALEWDEFVRRWRETRDQLPPSATAHEDEARAAVRLREVLDERPLLASGPRTALLSVWPAVLLGLGALCAVLGAGATGTLTGGVAGAVWGVLLGVGVEVGNRLLRGAVEHEAEWVDRLAASAYGALSPSELATRAALSQNNGFDRMREELARSNRELGEILDAGLRRIETSTAKAASLVSEEQKGSLRNVVEELRSSVRNAVERHVGSLQSALERAVEHQDAVSGGIARNYERMLENAETSERVSGALENAAAAVDGATRSISETVAGLHPVLDQLKQTGEALEKTAGRIDHTQRIAAGTMETVRDSLDRAAGAVGEQRELVELGLGEIRTIVERMSDGLGDQLAEALRNVDEALGRAVDRLRRTVDETNATVDRLGDPVRAAESATRDMHAALDRVRVDLSSMSQWLVQAVEPVRNTLSRIDEKSGSVSRALEGVSQRAERIERGLHGLGDEISEHGSALRAGAADLSLRLQRAADALESLERLPGTAAERPVDSAEASVSPDEPAASRSEPAPGSWKAVRTAEPEKSRPRDAVASSPSEALGAGAASGNAISSLLGRSEAGSQPPPAEEVVDVSSVEKPTSSAETGSDPDSGDEVDVDGPITYRRRFRNPRT